MNALSYDFRRPSRLAEEVEESLSLWLRTMCSLLAEKWGQQLSFPVNLTAQAPEVVRPADAMQQARASIGYRIELGPARIESLFVLGRPLALALMLGLLGDPGEKLPDDREPTLVELSLGEMAMQEFAKAVTESWPAQQPLACRLGTVVLRPERLRMFPNDENVVIAPIEFSSGFGTETCRWLIPHEGVRSLFSDVSCGTSKAAQETARPKLEALAREIPIEVSVRLGRATLRVSDLANLRCGDLVVLDQRIMEPLVASVDSQATFRGWPGRVGSRMAFQIESLVEA